MWQSTRLVWRVSLTSRVKEWRMCSNGREGGRFVLQFMRFLHRNSVNIHPVLFTHLKMLWNFLTLIKREGYFRLMVLDFLSRKVWELLSSLDVFLLKKSGGHFRLMMLAFLWGKCITKQKCARIIDCLLKIFQNNAL